MSTLTWLGNRLRQWLSWQFLPGTRLLTIQPYRITVKRKIMKYFEFRNGLNNKIIEICKINNIKATMAVDGSGLYMNEADYAKLCGIEPKARIILTPKPQPRLDIFPAKRPMKSFKPIRATTPAKFLRCRKANKKKDTDSPEKIAKENALLREKEGAPECARDLCMSRDDEKTWYSMFLVDWQNSHPDLCTSTDWYERNKSQIELDSKEYKKLYRLFEESPKIKVERDDLGCFVLFTGVKYQDEMKYFLFDDKAVNICRQNKIRIKLAKDDGSRSLVFGIREEDYNRLFGDVKPTVYEFEEPTEVKGIHGTTVEEFLAKVKASKKYWCDSSGLPYFFFPREKVENEYETIRLAEGAPPEAAKVNFFEIERNFTLNWFLPEWQNKHPELCQNKDWYIINKDKIESDYTNWKENKYSLYLFNLEKRNKQGKDGFIIMVTIPIVIFDLYLLWPLIKMIFGYIGFLLSLPFVFLFSMDSAGPQEFAMGFFFSFALFIAIVAFLLNLFR